ncbi:hypothetical protein AYO40_00670 [Planctomycetaceae bacterium SCGC AG-212-D15]|nr:hypothetical protein AYO40_00670 [Planctomycetaceae bacterium SCGC AG-212-D15]
MSSRTFKFDPELAWPWSLKPFGPWALLVVALLLIAVTLWTYSGVRGATVRRVLTVLGLRLAALILACLMIVRPAMAVRELTYLPAQLLILYDRSQSMSIVDEYDSKSRWQAMQELFTKQFKPQLDDLEKRNITITQHYFDGQLRDYDPDAKPDGSRTDIGGALNSLYKLHVADKNLLAVLLVSDGADNGTRFPPMAEAERWKKLPCRVYTVGLGKPTTSDRQADLAFTNLVVEPSPVPVKGKMTIRGMLDAPGFENATVELSLKIDDKPVNILVDGKPVPVQKETLRNKTANEVVVIADAPTTPGEIKVTLSVKEMPHEMILENNTISTFATVTKEGISVLLVDQTRVEQSYIRQALQSDRRFRVYMSFREGNKVPGGKDPFDYEKRQYDVILIGDVSPGRFAAEPEVLEQTAKLITDKGVGLLMYGGQDSFGNSGWANTPLGKLLPVTADATGQIKDSVRMEPTPQGLAKIVMRLKHKPDENAALWKRLPPFENGVTPLGNLDPGAVAFAVRAGRPNEPILASITRGKGRVLAFAADETYRWRKLGMPQTTEGYDALQNFWRQLVLYLAKQDEVDGSAWIKPEVRRLPAGGKLNFLAGLRGKGGIDLKDARFEVKVTTPGPDSTLIPVETAREEQGEHGAFWKTETPGEYRIEVKATGRDVDGKEVSGTASARFLVYQDEAEIGRRAADHDLLDKLARAGGGKFYPAQQLKDFFTAIDQQSVERSAVKTERWPDWDKQGSLRPRLELSPFLLLTFVTFTGLLCTEWVLRRRWGLV